MSSLSVGSLLKSVIVGFGLQMCGGGALLQGYHEYSREKNQHPSSWSFSAEKNDS